MTEFGTLHPDGTVTNVRTISQSSLMDCPHFILIPDHYRDDQSCRCDDADHTEMAEWGYRWNGYLWVDPGDPAEEAEPEPVDEIEVEEFSVIYSADWNPEDFKVKDLAPPKRHLWQMTEDDSNADMDYIGYTRHRKWCAILDPAQFDEFVQKTYLSADDVETMGSIGAPGFGFGWAPAISFTLGDEQGCYANAYVTPLLKGTPPADWTPQQAEEAWQKVRRQIIDKYR